MSMPSATLQLALRHHQSGELAEAERLYRQVLAAEPRNADAHHLLGLLALVEGRPEQAIEHFSRAIDCNPAAALFHGHLGAALQAAGRTLEAVNSYREAVRIDPRSASAHNDLGSALDAAGRGTEAEACYREALRLDPQFAEAYNNLGNVLQDRQDYAEAQRAFQAAAQLRPDLAEVHFNLGNCLAKQQNLSAATAAYRQTLALKPDLAAAHQKLGLLLQAQENFAAAADCHREVLKRLPGNIDSLIWLGVCLQKQGQIAEAKACYARVLEIRPHDVAAQFNLGTALQGEGREEEAESLYRAVLELDAEHTGALSGLWLIYLKRGALVQARATHDALVRVWPDPIEAHYLRGTALLLEGDCLAGWPEFEYRLQLKHVVPRFFSQPRWEGEDLGDRTLLVHVEYALGDVLQFIRYVRLVRERHPRARVLVEVQPQLVPLLAQSSFENLLPEGSPLGDFDVQVPLLSLPGIFRTTLETIPADIPYLAAKPELVERWRTRLAEFGGFKVGVYWQGNKKYAGDKYRSIPLTCFESLARVPGVHLISLQKHAGSEQVAEVADCFRVITLDGLDDEGGAFMDTAAVMKNLDLMITSDSAVAHLAGALGIPVWVATSAVPDWRWLLEREDCPWYPTMRLYRQARVEDWSEVFARLAADLRSLSAGASH
jgi:tetratricopeptide (TPR) repeat protein